MSLKISSSLEFLRNNGLHRGVPYYPIIFRLFSVVGLRLSGFLYNVILRDNSYPDGFVKNKSILAFFSLPDKRQTRILSDTDW